MNWLFLLKVNKEGVRQASLGATMEAAFPQVSTKQGKGTAGADSL